MRGKEFHNQTLTNTKNVKAESMVDRLVDQLVRHAVKTNMASQRNRTSTLTLKTKKIQHKKIQTFQLQDYLLKMHNIGVCGCISSKAYFKY